MNILEIEPKPLELLIILLLTLALLGTVLLVLLLGKRYQRRMKNHH